MILTPTEQKVLNAVKAQGKVTIASIATAFDMTIDNAGRNLRFLHKSGYIHIAGQEKINKSKSTNVYAFGEGEDVGRKEWQLNQDAARKAFTKRNTYDPTAPVVPNTGWVSTIHSKDYSMNHGEHIRFMERFQPQPDPASAWLFNKPKVELLGAKYE